MISIFSDDIEWCKTNLIIQGCRVFYIGTGRKFPVETLFVMSKFKKIIVSESTFDFFAYNIGEDFLKKEIIFSKPSRLFEKISRIRLERK